MILKEKKKESTDDLPLMPVDWDISRQDDSVPVRWLNKAMSLSVTFHRIPFYNDNTLHRLFLYNAHLNGNLTGSYPLLTSITSQGFPSG